MRRHTYVEDYPRPEEEKLAPSHPEAMFSAAGDLNTERELEVQLCLLIQCFMYSLTIKPLCSH